MTQHPSLAIRRRRAFTLIEILVVIGILVGLIGILVPTINKARKAAARSRMASDLQAISTALDAYKNDFGDYPRVEYTPGITNAATRPEPPTGAQVLCWALLGLGPIEEKTPPAGQHALQDGADGPGFRTRITHDSSGNAVGSGKVFGPYLPADKFHTGNPANPADKNPANALLWTLLDSNNKPILYAPASPKHLNLTKPASASATDIPTYIGQTTQAIPLQAFVWDLTDILGDATTNPAVDDTPAPNNKLFTRPSDSQANAAANRVRAVLGDFDLDGWKSAAETPASTGPYLLWMAGPDGLFGPTPEAGFTDKDIKNCDDVTNFNQ